VCQFFSTSAKFKTATRGGLGGWSLP